MAIPVYGEYTLVTDQPGQQAIYVPIPTWRDAAIVKSILTERREVSYFALFAVIEGQLDLWREWTADSLHSKPRTLSAAQVLT